MKPIYSIRFFVLFFTIALLVIGGCQKGSDDKMEEVPKAPPTPTPTPIFRPHTTPMPTDVPTTPDWTATEDLPAPLVCGQQSEVEVTVQDSPVNCRGYDYTSIYNRAHNIAVTRMYSSLGGVGSLTCPQACSPVHTWQITRSWSCLLDRASAYVRYGVLCPNPGQAKPTNAPFVTPVPSLSSGSHYNPPNIPTGPRLDTIKENHIRPTTAAPTPTPVPPSPTPACQSTDVKYIQYFEEVASCQNLNYVPYISRAEEWAALHHVMEPCVLPCTKQPLTIRDKRWKCVAGSGAAFLVNVDVTYVFNCR